MCALYTHTVRLVKSNSRVGLAGQPREITNDDLAAAFDMGKGTTARDDGYSDILRQREDKKRFGLCRDHQNALAVIHTRCMQAR